MRREFSAIGNEIEPPRPASRPASQMMRQMTQCRRRPNARWCSLDDVGAATEGAAEDSPATAIAGSYSAEAPPVAAIASALTAPPAALAATSAATRRILPPPPPPAQIPADTIPIEARHLWPRRLESNDPPLLIHHREGEEHGAQEVLEHLVRAWQQNVALGFRPPITAGDGYEVFLWRGIEEVSVVGDDEIVSTPWDDVTSYMIVDPWGSFGGPNLAHTMTHEMNHAFQSRDDWDETISIYEGSATFVEWEQNGLDDLLQTIMAEYQKNAALAPDAAGEGDTWYPYGFSLYLRFVQHTFANGEVSFLGRAWEEARNRHRRKPDVLDVIESLLPDFQYESSVVSFARWRWYTGERCRYGDCSRDPDAHHLPSVEEQRIELPAVGRTIRAVLDPAPFMLGSSYLALHATDPSITSCQIAVDNVPKGARVVVQAVPGLVRDSSGDTLRLRRGRGRVEISEEGWRTIIVTVLPKLGSARRRFGGGRNSRSYPLTITFVGKNGRD